MDDAGRRNDVAPGGLDEGPEEETELVSYTPSVTLLLLIMATITLDHYHHYCALNEYGKTPRTATHHQDGTKLYFGTNTIIKVIAG